MSNHYDVMPDFCVQLESFLASSAVEQSAPRPVSRARAPRAQGGRRRLRAGLLAGAVAAVAVGVITWTGADRSTDRAADAPPPSTRTVPAAPPARSGSYTPIWATAQVPVEPEEVVREAQSRLGRTADLTRAWATPAFGGTAYLMRDSEQWCLTAPDPATNQPDNERAWTCSPKALFERFGIALTVGDNYIAALPRGVRHPTLRLPGKKPRALVPSANGVVVLSGLPAGATITTYDDSGRTRSSRILPTQLRLWECEDGSQQLADVDAPDPCRRGSPD